VSLRVISGSAKGRRLKDVPGNTTRPVTDAVKEALFDILGGDVLDSQWWDLFAGTGAIGIEALSRGAASVRFSDLNRLPVQITRENLATCGFLAQAEVLRADAFSLLGMTPSRRFDFVYIAPPQYRRSWLRAIELLDSNPGWLNEHGWAIAQIHPREQESVLLQNFQSVDERRYGSTLLWFFERLGK
jgi:16S rRNA (guanine966-N2)-methyltransferase